MSIKQLKTTEAILNPDEWDPIAAWLRRHNVLAAPRGMFADQEALPGLAQMLRKAARSRVTEDITIRLSNDQMRALWQQIQFWSCCQEELRREFRRDMPRWQYFHCMAGDIGISLDETRRENDRRDREAEERRVQKQRPRTRTMAV